MDQRKNGTVAHIETAPGNVIVVPTWMLDPVACIGMELGRPGVSVNAFAPTRLDSRFGSISPATNSRRPLANTISRRSGALFIIGA